MTKKKAKKIKAKKKLTPKKSLPQTDAREKAYGDPVPVRPVSDYYDLKTGEVYPKIFFREDSWWDKIKRFFGYIP